MKDGNEHFIICVNCGGDIDCRDLSQVFYHEGDCLTDNKPKDFGNYIAKKVGDISEFTSTGIELPLN